MSQKQREKARAAIAALYAKYGRRTTPRLLVRMARAPTSPLHRCFEWDDGKAAQHWREDQARQLLSSVIVEIHTDTVTLSVVQYLRDPKSAAHEQGYVSVEDLQHDRRGAKAALRYECDRVIALLERVRGIALALGLVAEAEAALASVTRLRKRTA